MGKFDKGVAAVKKVQKVFKDVGALTAKIHAENAKAEISSCNATAQILGDAIIGNKPLTAVQGTGGKSSADKVKAIKTLLDSPKMVYINITPDHHSSWCRSTRRW